MIGIQPMLAEEETSNSTFQYQTTKLLRPQSCPIGTPVGSATIRVITWTAMQLSANIIAFESIHIPNLEIRLKLVAAADVALRVISPGSGMNPLLRDIRPAAWDRYWSATHIQLPTGRADVGPSTQLQTRIRYWESREFAHCFMPDNVSTHPRLTNKSA